MLDFTTFAIVLATIADVRRCTRCAPAPARAAAPVPRVGLPVVPALYLAANLAIAVGLLVGSPRECAIGARRDRERGCPSTSSSAAARARR